MGKTTMVMTSDRRGISCDLCGAEHKDKFEYYSLKIDKIAVDREVQKTGIVDVDRRFLDVDICPSCQENMAKQMENVISMRKSKTDKDTKNKANEWTTGE